MLLAAEVLEKIVWFDNNYAEFIFDEGNLVVSEVESDQVYGTIGLGLSNNMAISGVGRVFLVS